MKPHQHWLLPQGVEEVLPGRALRLERLRRQTIDALVSHGFDLVMPPLVEFLDALLTGVGEDLALETVKLTDPVSGRQMGVRADHTPQIARLDAHYLKSDRPSRLCYVGSVLRSQAGGSVSTREPLQIGAELYGNDDIASDAEIVEAMIAVLRAAKIPDIHLHLGHVGVYRALTNWADLPDELEPLLHDALRRQSRPDVEQILEGQPRNQEIFAALLNWEGNGESALAEDGIFPNLPELRRAQWQLRALIERLRETIDNITISVDLSELRGYRYHTGIVFNAYTPGHGAAIARGGRYDDIGLAFGSARSATGFSADLRQLLDFSVPSMKGEAILAPYDGDAALARKINDLRASGERVIRLLPEQPAEETAEECGRRLVRKGDEWVVEKFENK